MIEQIPVTLIQPSHFNPRTDEGANEELGASIETEGIREPLELFKLSEFDGFGLLDGHCRLHWAKALDLPFVPAIIRDDVKTEAEALEYMLIKALLRKGLSPLEEAKAFERLLKHKGITQAKLAAKLGRSQPAISNSLRLLKAPPELHEIICRQIISPKHVHTLLAFEKYPKVMTSLAQMILSVIEEKGSLTVQEMVSGMEISLSTMSGDLCEIFSDLEGDLDDHFDLEGCKKCSNAKTLVNNGSTCSFCMDPPCFRKKLATAEEESRKAEGVTSLDEFESEDLQEDEKEDNEGIPLFPDNIDEIAPAEEFEDEEDEDDQETTQKPEQIAPPVQQRIKLSEINGNNIKPAQARKMLDATLNAYFKERKTLNRRWRIEKLSRVIWVASTKRALKPWGKVARQEDIVGVIEKIPEGDLDEALDRLIMARVFTERGLESDLRMERTLKLLNPELVNYAVIPKEI